jgi:hypothetical protein
LRLGFRQIVVIHRDLFSLSAQGYSMGRTANRFLSARRLTWATKPARNRGTKRAHH